MGPIVPYREMLRATIVPKCDRMIAPAEANLPMRLGDVVEEKREHGIAFVIRQLIDASGEAAVDEYELAPGIGVLDDDGVDGHGIFRGRVPVESLCAVMDRREGLEERLHLRRKRLIGRGHAD